MIDLHCHSGFSDGTHTPGELISLAEQGGLSALALTDHDTTGGLDRLFAAAENSPVQAVAGIELSAEYGDIPLHILGYCFNPLDPALQAALHWVQKGRADRNVQILENLNRLGYELTHDDVQKHAGSRVVGRPHFAAALLEKGHFSHPHKVFRQLLGKGQAAYADRRRLSPERCVELIAGAGGVPAIAHPGQMRIAPRKLRRLIKRLKDHGLGGLEVWHPTHREHQIAALLRICEECGLVATGGSDFHGARTPHLSLGTGFGTLNVPDTVLEKMHDHLR